MSLRCLDKEKFEEDERIDENEEENDIPALLAVKQCHMDDISSIQTINPKADVVVNTTNNPKTMPVKDSATGKSTILAPGEGQMPSNIMRELHFDPKAFPLKYPSGNYGIHDEEIKPLSKKPYIRARLFHYKGTFSNDNDYLVMKSFIKNMLMD